MEVPVADTEPSPCKYLAVDRYLRDMLSTQALAAGFKTGLVDYLCEHPRPARDQMRTALALNEPGFNTLVDLLQAADVVQISGDSISLTEAFAEGLQYRDLLETKIHYANLVAPDVLHRFHQFIVDIGDFMQDAGLFRLFDYGRCHDLTAENLEATASWVRYTTLLSRYEAEPFMENFDLAGHEKLLDVGGNSGEFALQLCHANPDLAADVFDLPVVCNLGEKHLQGQAGGRRIRFLQGDLQHDELPDGYDLVLFKSFLHDWPSDRIEGFLAKACSAVSAGGTVVIFERSRITDHANINFGTLPVYLFHYFYREAAHYARILRKLGFTRIRIKNIRLDTPFMLVSAIRP